MIIDVSNVGGLVQVTFDMPVDGSTLAPDWLRDDTDATQTNGFSSQIDPVTAQWTADHGFTTGNPWSIVSAQPGVTFPQSGTVS